MFFRMVVRAFGSGWRLKELCNEVRHPLLKKFLINLYDKYQFEHGSLIAWNTQFAGPPCLPHGIDGIFVHGGASIGRNCVIFQQVTIGENGLPGSKGLGIPTIGDNCYIGAGAKIIGKVRVGNNVLIGANAVVHRDVPDNSVVLAGEQKVITREALQDTRHYTRRGPHQPWVYFDDGHWLPVTDQDALAKLSENLHYDDLDPRPARLVER